jgi:D-psicose/D-tagatose/L-ribulose 3-epimerase
MVKKQNYELRAGDILEAFEARRRDSPESLGRRLQLSWSNWGFGLEPLSVSAGRLHRAGVSYIELHGNLYGPDLGYREDSTKRVLTDCGLAVSGICGMFSADNDLSSPVPSHRQRAIDYIRRQVGFAAAVGADYMLVVPGAVGRPAPYDDAELHRSVETLHSIADVFVDHGVKAAIEPIRVDEVSLVNSVQDAMDFIAAVNHPGVQHINGDSFHMQTSEAHAGEAILTAGPRLVNLHLADSNRRALGSGALDVDTTIRALYLIGHNAPGRFVTFEPLGPGATPYAAMWSRTAPDILDELVAQSVNYFRERESVVLET